MYKSFKNIIRFIKSCTEEREGKKRKKEKKGKKGEKGKKGKKGKKEKKDIKVMKIGETVWVKDGVKGYEYEAKLLELDGAAAFEKEGQDQQEKVNIQWESSRTSVWVTMDRVRSYVSTIDVDDMEDEDSCIIVQELKSTPCLPNRNSTRRRNGTIFHDPSPPQWQSIPTDSKNKGSNISLPSELEESVILDRIPSRIRNHFGDIGFVPWTRRGMPRSLIKNRHVYSPVLILSPFDLQLENKMRVSWMKMFTRASATNLPYWVFNAKEKIKVKIDTTSLIKKKNQWKILVYHYSAEDNLKSAFSLVDPESFINYHEGVKKGYEFLPELIERRERNNLNKKEKSHLNALYQIRLDSTLETIDRGGSKFFPQLDTRQRDTRISNALPPPIHRGTNVWSLPSPFPGVAFDDSSDYVKSREENTSIIRTKWSTLTDKDDELLTGKCQKTSISIEKEEQINDEAIDQIVDVKTKEKESFTLENPKDENDGFWTDEGSNSSILIENRMYDKGCENMSDAKMKQEERFTPDNSLMEDNIQLNDERKDGEKVEKIMKLQEKATLPFFMAEGYMLSNEEGEDRSMIEEIKNMIDREPKQEARTKLGKPRTNDSVLTTGEEDRGEIIDDRKRRVQEQEDATLCFLLAEGYKISDFVCRPEQQNSVGKTSQRSRPMRKRSRPLII